MEQSRLTELVREMSLEEKINQLFQGNGAFYEGDGIATGPAVEQGFSEQTIREAGSVLSIVGAANVKRIQKGHMEKHPHHIPLLFMADVINGYKTAFPIPLAQGAAFNAEVARVGAEIAAKEAAAAGIHLTFAPMLDLVRDARWGRVMESTGEDAYLNSIYGKAMVEGFQGQDPKQKGKIGACVKHFAAYGAPIAGRDYNAVELSERTLREDYLPAYQAAIDAGALLVMTSFNTLNRIPSSANKRLLREILRDEMQFEGAVISDWAAIEELVNWGLGDKRTAAKLALEAGTDIDMMTSCYTDCLKELITNGELDEKLLDEAVLRVLELKNKLGLFENPCKDADEEEEKKLFLCPAHRRAAREAAAETFVLLENNGILPLDKKEKVAFIGPYVDERAMIGAWSIWADEKDAVSLREGVLAQGANAVFARGCTTLEPDMRLQGMNLSYTNELTKAEYAELLEEARTAAGEADKVVLCLGEHMAQTGEAASRGDITLPKLQKTLLREIAKINTNIVVVLFNGRPLDIREIKELAKAILVVWMPGSEGGNAIGDVLYGKEPSGRLPMSFPYSAGQVPVFYNEFSTGRPNDPRNTANRFMSKYMDIPNEPLYPFGFGRSYAEFSYSEVRLDKSILQKGMEDSLRASVTVKNISKRAGAAVPQLYIRDLQGSVARPVRELKGFTKIWLQAGEEKEVSFTVTEDMLRFYNIRMDYTAEEGAFHLWICEDSGKAVSGCKEAGFELK